MVWYYITKYTPGCYNIRFIWYLEKSGILDRSQCGFRKHRSTTDHLVSLGRYLRDAFARRQRAVGLFFDLEKAYETTSQYGIIWYLHRIGLRGRLPVFVSEYLRDRRIRVRIGTTLSDEFYPEEGVPTGGVLAVTCFGLKINEMPSCIAKDIFKAFFIDDLAICFRGRSLDTIERHLQQAVNSIQEWATRNGFRFAAHKCKVVHFTAPRSRAQRPPIVRIGNTFLPVEESTKFFGLWWDSHLSFKKHISVLKTQCKEALNLIRVVAHLKWGGDRDTLLMLYRAIVHPKFDYSSESAVPILTRIRRSLRYSDTKTGSLPLRPILWRSRMIPYCQVVSYAFSKSKKRPTACCLRANASRRYLSRLTRWSLVLRCFLKPHWLLSNIPDFSRYQMKRVLIMRSRTLHKQLVSAIGL